jgi:hypothetical protein
MQSITTTDGTTLTAPDDVNLAWAWAEYASGDRWHGSTTDSSAIWPPTRWPSCAGQSIGPTHEQTVKLR